MHANVRAGKFETVFRCYLLVSSVIKLSSKVYRVKFKKRTYTVTCIKYQVQVEKSDSTYLEFAAEFEDIFLAERSSPLATGAGNALFSANLAASLSFCWSKLSCCCNLCWWLELAGNGGVKQFLEGWKLWGEVLCRLESDDSALPFLWWCMSLLVDRDLFSLDERFEPFCLILAKSVKTYIVYLPLILSYKVSTSNIKCLK